MKIEIFKVSCCIKIAQIMLILSQLSQPKKFRKITYSTSKTNQELYETWFGLLHDWLSATKFQSILRPFELGLFFHCVKKVKFIAFSLLEFLESNDLSAECTWARTVFLHYTIRAWNICNTFYYAKPISYHRP